ncbi:hypothetical protein MRX96_007402 [Rhipicephalus microplus]
MAHSLTPIPPPRPDYPRWPPVYDESAICPWGATPHGPPPVKRPCFASIRRGPTRLPEVCTTGVLPSAFWEDGHQRGAEAQVRDAWCKACQARLWKLKKTCLVLMTQIREEIVQGRLSAPVAYLGLSGTTCALWGRPTRRIVCSARRCVDDGVVSRP